MNKLAAPQYTRRPHVYVTPIAIPANVDAFAVLTDDVIMLK